MKRLFLTTFVVALFFFGATFPVQAQTAAAPAPAQEDPPKKELIYESPLPGSTVSGTVKVTIKPVNFDPKITFVVCALQSHHIVLKKQPDKRWTGELDTTLLPNGPVELYFSSDVGNNYPVEKTFDRVLKLNVDNPTKIFFGDVHAHTSYSDGALLPKHAFDMARDEVKLDFFLLTDHRQRMVRDEWLDQLETVSKYNENGKFTTLPSFESRDETHTNWHFNAFNVEELDWPTDYEGVIAKAVKNGVVLQFNHPGVGRVFNNMAYHEPGDTVFQLMEVRRPQEEIAFQLALKNGWHLAPTGSDDMHWIRWGMANWTGVHIPALTRANLFQALKNRRVYSTNDRNCELYFSINDSLLGDIAESPTSKLTCSFRIFDPDENDVIAKVEVISDGKVMNTFDSTQNVIEKTFEIEQKPEAGEQYYYLRVTQADKQMLWSAPIWITVVE
jgi:hypothetical protein